MILAALLLISLFVFLLHVRKNKQQKIKQEKELIELNKKILDLAQIILDKIKDINNISKAQEFIAAYEKNLKVLQKEEKRLKKEYDLEQKKNVISKLFGGKKRKELIKNEREAAKAKVIEYETKNSAEYNRYKNMLSNIDISFYNRYKSSIQEKYEELEKNKRERIEKENAEKQKINEEKIKKQVYSKRMPQMIGRLEEYVVYLQKYIHNHPDFDLYPLRHIENNLDEIRSFQDCLSQKDVNRLETCLQKIMLILNDYKQDELFKIDICMIEDLISKIIEKRPDVE